MFTTGIFVPSLLGISTLGDWRISGAGRGKSKKERKAAVAVTTTIFFVLCEKEPYILRDHIEQD